MGATTSEQRPPRSIGRFPQGLILGLLAFLLIAQQVRDLVGFNSIYTDEDQTLLWLAGRELARLRLRTPNFWGQNYNTVFEALPGEILHLLGVSLRVSDPLGVAGLVTTAWLVIAWMARRSGYVASAALALGLPLFLSLNYLLCIDLLRGVMAGDFLSALAVAAAVGIRCLPLRLGIVITLAGVAYQWDNATALAGAPALVAALSTDWRTLLAQRRWAVISAVLGLIVPAAWFAYAHLWYSAHPGALLQPSVPSRLSLSVLTQNIEHPGPVFRYYAPEIVNLARLVEILLVALVGAAILAAVRFRRLAPAAVGICFALVLLVVLSVQDTATNYEPNLYLAGSRFLLPMPFGIWLVAHCLLDSRRDATPSADSGPYFWTRARLPGLFATVVGISALSAVVAQSRFNSDVRQLIAYERSPNPVGVTIENAASLLASCKSVTAAYNARSAQIMVTADRTLNYGCAAQTGINTIFPPYERRSWVIAQATTTPVSRILFEGGYSCEGISARLGKCEVLGNSLYMLSGPPAPLVRVLAALHIPLYDGPAHPNLAASMT